MAEMKKKDIVKVCNLKDLEELRKNENSCIHLHKIQHHLALHPYHLSDIKVSLTDILNERLGKFSAGFDGILCGYKNIKLLSPIGSICDDSCFIHVDIEADFYIFKPIPKKILHGIINKKSEDHIGCLVHKVFNVSLPKPKHAENWIGNSLPLNSEIELQITRTNFDGKLPYIRGAILSDLTESSEQNVNSDSEQNVDENVITHPKKTKKAKKTLFTDSSEPPVAKKSKKRKRKDDSLTEQTDVNEEETLPPPKRKRHRED